MYVYTVTDMPAGEAEVWSHLFLQPLAPGVLTPFSLSVLSEVLGRTWFQYYDQLGFAPGFGANVIRRQTGQPFLNMTLSAARESDRAGVRPMALRLNERDYPIAAWKKPGFLDGMRVGRQQRKISERFHTLAGDVDQTISRASSWYGRVSELNWGQAELLQVMEQIERISLASYETYFAARRCLEWSYNRLIQLSQESFPASLTLINNAVSSTEALVENSMAEQMLAMASLAEQSPETLAWLKSDSYEGWADELPNRYVRDALDTFLTDHGHRSADEGEMRHTRWHEDPSPILKGILACAGKTTKQPLKMPATQNRERLLATIDGKTRKEAGQLLEQIGAAQQLQSKALNAIAYILAGTRRWALAAAEEAMNDGRLADADDIFFFELEEIKRMMTGEWNISDVERIRSVAVERRETYAEWQEERVPDYLIGDAPAESAIAALPGSAGQVVAPLRRWDTLEPHVCNGAVVGVEQLSSGWAIVLPVAQGLITPTGTPMDPLAVAARAWHTPIMMGLGDSYDVLVAGAQTTVDADRLIVDQ